MTKARVAKFMALAGSTLVCLLLGEVGVRVASPQTLSIWSHTRDGIVIHQAGIRGHMTPAGKRIDTNSIGMRDREHPVAKPSDTFRILLFGDSFMEATQVDWENTLAAQLEARLNDASEQKVEVINASVSGWGTDDQLTYYLRYARAFAPDLILVAMTLHNDVSDNMWMKFHSFEQGKLVEKPPKRMSTSAYARLRIKEWFASNSHLYRLLVGSLRAEAVRIGGAQLDHHLSELVRQTPSPQNRAGWAMTLQLLDALREQGAKDSSEMAVFLVPLSIQVREAQLDQLLDAFELDRSELALERPQEIMLTWSAERDVAVMDLLPDFREWAAENRGSSYLADDGHWNERGHALATGIVARELIASELVPSVGASR